MALSCLDRALSLASDTSMADVWYNIGQVAIGIGDLGLAYQAFKIAISVDSSHAEAYANLGVLELRKGNIEAARSNFRNVQTMAPHMFEPFFNGALLAYTRPRLTPRPPSFSAAVHSPLHSCTLLCTRALSSALVHSPHCGVCIVCGTCAVQVQARRLPGVV
jgi:tetratricopeptide (TPR) repeat protein